MGKSKFKNGSSWCNMLWNHGGNMQSAVVHRPPTAPSEVCLRELLTLTPGVKSCGFPASACHQRNTSPLLLPLWSTFSFLFLLLLYLFLLQLSHKQTELSESGESETPSWIQLGGTGGAEGGEDRTSRLLKRIFFVLILAFNYTACAYFKHIHQQQQRVNKTRQAWRRYLKLHLLWVSMFFWAHDRSPLVLTV